MTPRQQRKMAAAMLGYVSGMHALALEMGVDQLACAMEDVSGMLNEIMDPTLSGPEAMAVNL